MHSILDLSCVNFQAVAPDAKWWRSVLAGTYFRRMPA